MTQNLSKDCLYPPPPPPLFQYLFLLDNPRSKPDDYGPLYIAIKSRATSSHLNIFFKLRHDPVYGYLLFKLPA